MKKLLSMLLAAIVLLGAVGAAAEQAEADAPLVVSINGLSGRFSPFFGGTARDAEVVDRTQINMMTVDRSGEIVYNGIEGETRPCNGTDYTYYGTGDLSVVRDRDADLTTYTYRMRDDLKFSDGEPVSIDDVIFDYYVLLDPAYNGDETLGDCDIVGLRAYRTQIPEAHLDEIGAVVDAVRAAGPGYRVKADDPFTAEAYDAYYDTIDALWVGDVRGIVDYAYENYGPEYAEATLRRTFEELGESEGLKVALGMALWGFGSVNGDFTVLTESTGREYDLAGGA